MQSIKLSKLTDQPRESLNNTITTFEIDNAINKLKSNKAPGPDGFTAIFHKTFKEELGPLEVMNQALTNKQIPESWKEANIILIHKEHSDPTEIRNYRPISLLNIDYKIFTSILANRFKFFY
uniref:Reverse transcriptase domain-containing protein n=1 Tax=Anolis carolinensis TaxID=28377 RepID=A0A803U0T4_ANOCA